MFAQIEADSIVKIDAAVRSHPFEDVSLLVVLCPGQRRCCERIIAVADVRALGDKSLYHGEVSLPRRPMQGCAVIDADHVPAAVLLEEEIHGLGVLVDICEEHRQTDGVAFGHCSASTTRPRS